MSIGPTLETQAKWDRLWQAAEEGEPEAAKVLKENAHLLPAAGTALDLACGLGGNALFLAQFGLKTSAWDISPVAVENLKLRAAHQGLDVIAETRDVEAHPPEDESFDVIVVSRFLYRPLCPVLINALRPGGLLYYQTYTQNKLSAAGPRNPAYLLAINELLTLFRPLQLLFYREEGHTGELTRGFRDEAMLVARKP